MSLEDRLGVYDSSVAYRRSYRAPRGSSLETKVNVRALRRMRGIDALVIPIHHSGFERVEKGHGRRNGMITYRLEVTNTLSGHLTLLSTQETLLLEDEGGSDQGAAADRETDSDSVCGLSAERLLRYVGLLTLDTGGAAMAQKTPLPTARATTCRASTRRVERER